MLWWLLIGLAAWIAYIVFRLWPLLWAITSSDPIVRMKRIRAVANRYFEGGKLERAAELYNMGLWFAGEPQKAKTPEIRRLGSDLAALSALAYGHLDRFQVAQMMAHHSVLRDETNPFAHEILGLSLASNGHIEDAHESFMKGLRVARESQPVDTEAEERINRQLQMLPANPSPINQTNA